MQDVLVGHKNTFHSRTDSIKLLLQGSWFGKEFNEHAVFSIRGDTITYIDDFSNFKYSISKDTFNLLTKEPHYKQIILKLTKDSLVLKDLPGQEISKYWR
jgi:hypothetical protein